MKDFKNLKEFYPYYLSEHQHPVCRALHFLGTLSSICLLAYLIYTAQYQHIWICLVIGYLCAWIGHFFFEKNRPATFKYPVMSFVSDFIFCFDVLRGKEKLN